jgi:hypothetical protein
MPGTYRPRSPRSPVEERVLEHEHVEADLPGDGRTLTDRRPRRSGAIPARAAPELVDESDAHVCKIRDRSGKTDP